MSDYNIEPAYELLHTYVLSPQSDYIDTIEIRDVRKSNFGSVFKNPNRSQKVKPKI